ncbi:MAG: HDOD domain-containing protein [Deltaproteobacteria bacterium]|nr:HDOD domain-containing protein [Deltaproteobacteria bacterium]MBW1947133.1 HDOD domain-containing protein [Deltaproteobacteria bacterium]MBW1966910.1 HDOD domain-containing protein [Deltaproteobacteria bacterium]MBW2098418.1 HDOD domain-containing protein [Deltaproteobacteria bacterium]
MSIIQRLDNIHDLPSMPHTLNSVLEGLDSISSSARTMEKIIRDDPVLTAKMLHIANSPYYGMRREVSSIARAVVILGFEEVRNIAIGLSLTGVFSHDLGFEEFDAKGIWLHSIGVAKVSKILAEDISGLETDELFTAGMVHDLGRFLLCLYFPSELREILKLRRQEGLSLSGAEEKYGLTHSEVGAYLAERWNLSEMLTDVIRYHHYPNSAGPNTLASSVVFLADEICQKMKFGWHLEGEPDKVLIPRSLGLSQDTVKKAALYLKDERENIEAGWGAIFSG